MNRRMFLPVMLAFCFVQILHAQGSENARIQRTIESLFAAMAASDSAAVRAVFDKQAAMGTIAVQPDGKPVFRNSPGALEGFIKAVGSPHEEVWDERPGKMKISVDGNMASARVPYRFFRGKTFSHCGVNHFVLMKTADSWLIVSVVDTRHKEPCPER